LCQDVFANTNDNEKKTKGWNSNGKNTRAEGWQVGVKNDANVEGDILKGEKEEATRQFSICVEKKFRANDEKAHVT
jgi:hypothetical protein